MKQSKISCILFCAAISFFFVSCGGGSSEETTNTDTTSTPTTTATEPAPVNTIVTTPQSMVSARHKVSNYAKWKADYDAHDSARLANGLHSYVIGRGLNDTNMVFVVMKADDMAKAKAFAQSADLKKIMQKAGVVGTPEMSFTTVVWQDTANVGSIPRSITNFNVKDWDAWQKNFEDGNQERLDNGVVTRSIGHDADDNKKVTLVTALTDTTRAFAYYKSDALKKRREAGGVIGEPKRFLFNIVQRYR